jgi:hypothetical protein
MDKRTDPTLGQLRLFGALWTPMVLVLLALRWQRPPFSWILVGFAIVSFVAALVRPGVLRPLFWLLGVVTAPIGYFVSRVVLTIVFFAIVMPLGLLRRRRVDVLGLRFDRTAATYWQNRPGHPRDVGSYFRQSDE